MLCASGFQRMEYVWDPEYLLSPTTGPAKVGRLREMMRLMMAEVVSVHHDGDDGGVEECCQETTVT